MGYVPESEVRNSVGTALNLTAGIMAQEETSVAYVWGMSSRGTWSWGSKTRGDKYYYDRDHSMEDLAAALGTEDWDKVSQRVYMRVEAEDGSVTYAVLELRNARQGNENVGRLEVDDVTGETTGTLKPVDSPVSKDDIYAIWVYEVGVDYTKFAPNGVVTKWGEDENGNPVPLEFTARISGDADSIQIIVKTEDSFAGISVYAENESRTPWSTGTAVRSRNITPGVRQELKIEVLDQNKNLTAGPNSNGTVYDLILQPTSPDRRLQTVTVMGDSLNEYSETTVTAQQVVLTVAPTTLTLDVGLRTAIREENNPIIQVYRKNPVTGNFDLTDVSTRLDIYAAYDSENHEFVGEALGGVVYEGFVE